MSTDADIQEAVSLTKKALEEQVGAGIGKVWTGPRSTELGFYLEDGREVTLSVRVKVPGQ